MDRYTFTVWISFKKMYIDRIWDSPNLQPLSVSVKDVLYM